MGASRSLRSARSARLLALVAVSLGATLVACSLLTGLDADYRLQSSGTGEGGKDGDFAPGDGSTDDVTDDRKQPGEDGGPDGKSDAPFCSGDPGDVVFCTDFEEADAGNVWSTLNDVGASIARSKALAGVNETRGMEFLMTQGSGASKHAWLATLVSGCTPPSSALYYEVEFEFRVPSGATVPTLVYAALGTLSFTSAVQQDHGVAAYDGNQYRSLTSAGPPQVLDPEGSTWHHARIRLDRQDASTMYNRKITIDSTVVDQSTNHNPGAAGTCELRLGIFNTATDPGSMRATFDNVRIRRK